MREIATKKKPVFVQANSNSGQGHVLHYITSFCVVFRLSTLYFWLAGKTETKQVVNRMSKWVEGGGSWKGHESGQAVLFFLRLRRSCARLDKIAMLHTLTNIENYVRRAMTSLLMSSPPISISHRLFRCRYSNSRDVVASSPSFSRPAARAPRRACSQAMAVAVTLTLLRS